MAVIENTTGHSRSKEKSMARFLYIAIVAAVIIGAAMAIMAGRSNTSLNPYGSDNTHKAAPDAGAPPPAK